jgi:hypothetical protein
MNDKNLIEILSDFHERIQCGRRLLEDHADVASEHLSAGFGIHSQKILALELDRAFGDADTLGQKSRYRK